MSEHVQIALIVSLPPTLAALTGLCVSVLNWLRGKHNERAVEEVHKLVNSRSMQQDQKIIDLERQIVELTLLLAQKPQGH